MPRSGLQRRRLQLLLHPLLLPVPRLRVGVQALQGVGSSGRRRREARGGARPCGLLHLALQLRVEGPHVAERQLQALPGGSHHARRRRPRRGCGAARGRPNGSRRCRRFVRGCALRLRVLHRRFKRLGRDRQRARLARRQQRGRRLQRAGGARVMLSSARCTRVAAA